MYVKRGTNGSISGLVAKVTDDILMAGPLHFMADFAKCLGDRFPISKIILDKEMIFNGAIINQDNTGKKYISKGEYMTSIKPICTSSERKKVRGEKAGANEIKAFQILSGELT